VSEVRRRTPTRKPAPLRLASSQTAGLGPPHYYGGPKSPMWREQDSALHASPISSMMLKFINGDREITEK
jgi:hypothetical protein